MSEEQQTFNALTDNEIDMCLEDLIEHGFHAEVFDVFSQAKEANRLRAAFETIKLEIDETGDINPLRLLEGINELLEGER